MRTLGLLTASVRDLGLAATVDQLLVGRELGPCVTRAGHLVIPYETTSEAAIRMPLDGLAADFSRAVFVDLVTTPAAQRLPQSAPGRFASQVLR